MKLDNMKDQFILGRIRGKMQDSVVSKILFFVLPIAIIGLLVMVIVVSKFIYTVSINSILARRAKDISIVAYQLDSFIKDRLKDNELDVSFWRRQLRRNDSSVENTFTKEAMTEALKSDHQTKKMLWESIMIV